MNYELKQVSDVEEEVGVEGAVGVADAEFDGAEEGVVAVAELHAEDGGVGEELGEVVVLDGCGEPHQDIVTGEDSELHLHLGGEEVVAEVFEVADAGEGCLLFDGMGEPFAADGVAVGDGDLVCEEEAGVEHGLEREPREGCDVDTPVGVDVADADAAVVGDEVGGAVVVDGAEAGATRGEVPLVFVVEVGGGVVGEVVVVGEGGYGAVGGEELAVVVEVVPAETGVDFEVAEPQVERGEVGGVLVVAYVVGAGA